MKPLFLSICMLVLTTVAFSQNCLRIIQPTAFSGPEANGTYTLTITYETEGNKSLRTTIFCGADAILDDCFSATGPGTKVYSNLTCDGGLTSLSARFITKTGSCNARACDSTFVRVRVGVLPVKMNTFSAVRSKQTVTLNWSTEQEIDSKEFIIERAEGNVYRSVGTITGAGNSNTKKDYTFNDINSNTGVTYYRLKNVDINGRVTYSEVRTVKGSGTGSDVTVFPNPASSNSRITIVGAAANSSIQLIDFSGKVLKNYSNSTINSFDLSGVKSGTYILRILDKITNEVVNKKITVMN